MAVVLKQYSNFPLYQQDDAGQWWKSTCGAFNHAAADYIYQMSNARRATLTTEQLGKLAVLKLASGLDELPGVGFSFQWKDGVSYCLFEEV